MDMFMYLLLAHRDWRWNLDPDTSSLAGAMVFMERLAESEAAGFPSVDFPAFLNTTDSIVD